MVKLELQDGNSSALITVPEQAGLQVRRDADADLTALPSDRIGFAVPLSTPCPRRAGGSSQFDGPGPSGPLRSQSMS